MAVGFTKSFTEALSDTPAKGMMVGMAVAHQLATEGHPPPLDTSKVMGADYRYTLPQMQGFLQAVQTNLTQGKPSFAFSFDGTFTAKALNMRVGVLIGAISDQTN